MTLVVIDLPSVDIDLRYATTDNLTGRPIYRRALALLHPDALAALARAAVLADAQGLRLRLYDAFRPVEAQRRLWQALPNPDFIADPAEGSTHSRGVAVDLTLAAPDGAPLDLGTGFDDMTPLSYHGATGIPAEAQRRRSQLLGIMAAAGWCHYAMEWWHYQLPDATRHPLLTDGADGPALL